MDSWHPPLKSSLQSLLILEGGRGVEVADAEVQAPGRQAAPGAAGADEVEEETIRQGAGGFRKTGAIAKAWLSKDPCVFMSLTLVALTPLETLFRKSFLLSGQSFEEKARAELAEGLLTGQPAQRKHKLQIVADPSA